MIVVTLFRQGNQLQKIQTSSWDHYHTATRCGDLIYTDRDKKVILRITPNKKITEFIKTVEWGPLSVHSSRINRDILMGMIKAEEDKVTRYSKEEKNSERKEGQPRTGTV